MGNRFVSIRTERGRFREIWESDKNRSVIVTVQRGRIVLHVELRSAGEPGPHQFGI
jgi:hypothetical protein